MIPPVKHWLCPYRKWHLLNMDEKGDRAVTMDDEEPESREQAKMEEKELTAEENSAEPGQIHSSESPQKPDKGRAQPAKLDRGEGGQMADRSGSRVSVKEKLAEMRKKMQGVKMPDNSSPARNKEKAESL